MNNPFAPKPFGSQTGTSMFGGTSTGVFGATSSSSTPAFGASSSPGFGNSSPFGASSVPAFGSSSTSFGGFGQPSSSSFASQSVFGQSNNATSNPFAPKPFGSQSGTSMFGGTSTGVFGATPSSSPFSSTPTFGASSSPGFGNSSPSFGASSTPAFISSSASFGGSSLFGQKPAFGGFGSSTQSSPFGSTFQQSQPAFGSGIFGSSSSFGASSQPSFGASSTPAFGSSSTPAFGSASMPGFGATTTPAFGSTASPTFGSTGTAFGVSSTPAFASGGAFGASSTSVFGSSSGPGFGASSTPTFGASSSPAFGASTTPLFGASSTPAFGTSSSPSFSFGSSPAFGQSTSAFGTSPFGSTAAPFGAQSSPFGSQATTPTFGSSAFGQPALGGQRGGSRIAPYTPTVEADSGSTTQPAMKLESVSAMPVYKDKSHEELRWEDYQLGDKGGPNPASQPAAGTAFGVSTAQSNPFAASSTFGQSSTNPFSASTASNPFAPKQPSFGTTGFGASSAPTFGSSPFGSSSTSNLFSSTSSAATSLFGASSTPAFGSSSSPSLFGTSSSSAFGSSPSPFGASSAPGTTPSFGSGLNFGASQSSPLFQSTTPSLGQTGSPFGQIGSSFGQSAPFGQSSIFSTPSTGFGGNIFSSTPAQISTSSPLGFGQSMPSLSTPYQPTQTLQGPSTFGFSNFGQTQAAGSSGFGGASSIFGQSFGQPSAMQSSAVVQPVAVANPFGILPSMPQMSLGNAGSSPSIQYGISSLPVVHKPSPVRISSLLTTRHLSQRRIRLPARKYHPENDGTKVPFFHDDDDDEAPRTPKADALFIPRDNPRALIIRPKDQWPLRGKSSLKAASMRENGNAPQKENEHSLNGSMATINDVASREDGPSIRVTDNGVDDNTVNQKGDSYITLSGHRAGEAAIVYEHGADIESMMPKLRHSDYYTEPRIQELAAKERTEPGFCKHVINFVVGRQGYGSIRFLGETDVRRLDLESIIQFNNREVIVYMDDTKKPPVGQGLNKPAEVTLLNIKCYDKKNGGQYTEGPKIEKYKEMLKKKAEDQGAEFVSYDPVKGEWKFRVSHFSKYTSGDDDF